MKTKTQHTPTPWKLFPGVGEDLDGVMSEKVNAGGNFYIAQCNVKGDAEFIVRAVNSHEALLSDHEKFSKLCVELNNQKNILLEAAKRVLAEDNVDAMDSLKDAIAKAEAS